MLQQLKMKATIKSFNSSIKIFNYFQKKSNFTVLISEMDLRQCNKQFFNRLKFYQLF